MNEWTTKEAREFLEIMRGEAEKVYKEQGDKRSSVYACMAVVTDVAESGDISVRLLSSPSDGSQDFIVPNQSGSVVDVGDSVWLHYWGDYTNAYIGIRNGADSTPENAGLTQSQIVDLIYPVGAIYMSVASVSPATLFGGTWVPWGTGRVPVGIDTSDAAFDTVEKTGGAKTHTLSTAEMPTHNHGGKIAGTSNGDYMGLVGGGQGGWGIASSTNNNIYRAGISNDGSGSAHNNLQPYIACYMWKRTL